jgi:nitrite reductase (NADH) small subunit
MMPRSQALHPIAGEPVDLGPVGRVPIGEGRAYSISGRSFAIFRTRDGSLHALDNRCPQCGCALADGIIGGGFVVCPLHARRYELDGGACAGDRVRSYPAFVVAGRMIVLVG